MPILKSDSVTIGSNTVMLHEISSDDYYNFVLDENFAKAVIKAHGEVLSEESELTESEEVYQSILKDRSNNYRLVAASMLNNYVEEIAGSDRRTVFEEIENQLRRSLSGDNLNILVDKVTELMGSSVPKKGASIENSFTDSPAS